MPNYEYQCGSCEFHFEQRLPIARHDEGQDCPECGTPEAKKLVSAVGFILKGDGWAGKNNRIKNQMGRKNRRLDGKTGEMKREAPVASLSPNVEGEQTETWAEAKSLAASKGKETSSYDSYIRKEKAGGRS